MIGVRPPSRVVRPDIMRGLLVVAALLAVGVGHHGPGVQGAAKSKPDLQFVDPFLPEDVAAPGDDEIPGISELELPPDADHPSNPAAESDLETRPRTGSSPRSISNPRPVSNPKPVATPKTGPKTPKKKPAEFEIDDEPMPQNMPTMAAPRLNREIKKTAIPRLGVDDESIPGDAPELNDRQKKLPSLKNLPNGGKPGWKSTGLEATGSEDADGKSAGAENSASDKSASGKTSGDKFDAGGPPAESARFEKSREIEDLKEPIEKIVIEGNKTIKTEEIKKLIKTREGRVPEAKQIKEDVAALISKRWFFDVEPRIARSKDGPGKVLVFKVNEKPMMTKITYVGNKKIKEKALAELTGLKVNGGYDVGQNREAVHRILDHYRDKGFQYVTVELEKGDDPQDREVIFKIVEGPKVVVNKISFVGNKYFSSSVLKTQVKTKKVILWWFGGKYDPSSIPEDIEALKKYYQDLGFFDVQITSRKSESEDKSKIHIEYVIEEGVRFKIRNIEFVGNRVIPEDKLRENLKMKPNALYALRFVNVDKDKMVAQYGELGRIKATVDPRTRSFEEPGYVDLVYEINEDRPYRIGRIHVRINGDHPHTKESAVLTKLIFKPGELANQAKIDKSKLRLKGCGLFAGGNPGQGGAQQGASPPEIVLRPSELPTPHNLQLARGQDDSVDRPRRIDRQTASAADGVPAIFRGQNSGNGAGGNAAGGSGNIPQVDDLPFSDSQEGPPPDTYVQEEETPYIDAQINVFETQTGRINMGVGVNSNVGLLGNVTLEENNFDIMKPPTSIQEIFDGTAFRGGGQQFRIEAMPGLWMSRYVINWRDPYFLDKDVMLGVSGSYYNRYFYNWTERREGGRVTLGHQFTPYLSGSLMGRAEFVNISNPSVPIPPDYLAVLGENFLSTVSANVVHDTRDHPMLPGSGHYLQASVEQGMADFVYQKYDLDAKQFFLIKERPDGGNRHVLSFLGNIGWIGNQAPFFERFFGGGFGISTFRGFQYQGVTPTVDGVRIGGQFQALGTVEYQIPITADNMIQIVTFTDFGTVDSSITFGAYRQSVGAGLRLTIPMMGPVPIAVDFAVPIFKQPFDTTQVISFSMGAAR